MRLRMTSALVQDENYSPELYYYINMQTSLSLTTVREVQSRWFHHQSWFSGGYKSNSLRIALLSLDSAVVTD
ncbi:hypothetical protein LINGRAHAP2_LOCUS9525 [Linum grandiflorum]